MGNKNIIAKENEEGMLVVEVVCEQCGGPIVKTNRYGMFCEAECGLEESKKVEKVLKSFLELFN